MTERGRVAFSGATGHVGTRAEIVPFVVLSKTWREQGEALRTVHFLRRLTELCS